MSPQNFYRAGRCNYAYYCVLAADGTFTLGPEGWKASKTATGIYLITHNLGTTNYAVLPNLVAPDYKRAVSISDQSANTLTLATWNNQQAADSALSLIVMAAQ